MPLHGKIRAYCVQLIASCSFNKNRVFGNRSFATSSRANMRFVQFIDKEGGSQQLGVQLKQNGEIISLSSLDSQIPNSLKEFLEGGEELINKAKQLVAANKNEKNSRLLEEDVELLPPISRMDKLLCIALNYSGHCKEHNLQIPLSPIVFNKFPSNIIGPHDDIHLPTISNEVDWEAELAVVIGKKGKNLSKKEAEDCIFGYTLAQDLSARDWFKFNDNDKDFFHGKAMDNFCPLGPAVVTKDSIADVNNLAVRTYVNGKLEQNGNTSELIFKPTDLISYISQFMTLLPGDLILTGTPSGVGFSRNPPEFLKAGDVLVTEIEPIGRLRNHVF